MSFAFFAFFAVPYFQNRFPRTLPGLAMLDRHEVHFETYTERLGNATQKSNGRLGVATFKASDAGLFGADQFGKLRLGKAAFDT